MSGVDAPDVRPIVTGPAAGSHPSVVTSALRPDRAMPDRVGRDQAVRVGDVKRRLASRADAGEIDGVAAVIAADDDHQVDGLLAQQRDDGVLPVLRGAADRVERLVVRLADRRAP